MGKEVIEKTLTQLNTFSFQPRRKLLLRNMEINKKYSILTAQKVLKMNKSKKTAVKLEVDNVFIYLPERFKKLPDHIWNNLNNQNIEISNVGRHNNTCHLTFSSTKAAEAEGSNQFDITEYLNNFAYSPSYDKESI